MRDDGLAYDERASIADTARSLSPERRRELAEAWRERADRLDAYARRTRVHGDVLEAEDAETAALDYRAAAEWMELAA